MNTRRLVLCAILFGIALLALLVVAAPTRRSIAAHIPSVGKSYSSALPWGAAAKYRTETHNSSLSAPSAPLAFQFPDAGSWQVETVDAADSTGYGPSLALDSGGNPHISYVDISGFGLLRYARKIDGAWDVQAVPASASLDATSLVLDSNDRPHISFFSDLGCKLMYARWTGNTWDIQEVEGDHVHGWATSLALDSEGHPHIAYDSSKRSDSLFLRYAHWTGSGWDIQTVDADGARNSMALDGQDHPHISYCSDGILKYARWTGSNWLIQTVDAGDCVTNLVGDPTSLALDAEDRGHIAYGGWNYLKYARWTGSNWVIQSVAKNGWKPSLVIDSEGRPHISYGGVGYAHWTGTEWSIQSIRYGADPSLALDSQGRPHISYRGPTNDLVYARFLPPPFTLDKQAETSEGLRHGHTVTYSLTLSGVDVSVQLWDPLPPTLNYVEGSVTPPAAYDPDTRAVVWEGVLPETPLVFQFQARLNVADAKPPSWPMPIVNTAWLTDTEWGRVISTSATVNALPTPLTLYKRAKPSDGVRNIDTVTYTLVFSSADFIVHLWDPLPGNVQYVSGTLTSTVTPPAVYSTTANAVTWEGTLPSTLQEIRFQVTPEITRTGSLSLSLPIVNTAWLTETESGMSVSATVIVNGRRVYMPLLMRQH